MTSQPKLYPLLWLTSEPDTVTIGLDGANLVVRTGPYESQQAMFSCRDEAPLKSRRVQAADPRLVFDLFLEEAEDDEDQE